MAKYVVGRGWVEDFIYSEDARDPGQRSVMEGEPKPTGLFDRHGNALVRLPNPIGFGHHG